MARTPEPWRRQGQSGAWYAQVRGKQVRLANPDATKTDARVALARILAHLDAAPRVAVDQLTVADVLNLAGADAQARARAGQIREVTLDGYLTLWRAGRRDLGDIPAAALTPERVRMWATSRGWGPSRQRAAVQAIRSAVRAAHRQGLLSRDPLADLRPPRALRREFDATAEIRARLASDATDGAWGAFLTACVETGCRPGEVASVTAADFDAEASTWTVANKTAWSTGERTRIVYLTPVMVHLSSELAAKYPTGPLFRNRRGRPWRRWAWGGRMRRARQRLGLSDDLKMYSLRHAWGTDAVEAGVNPIVAAELMGHRSVDMLMKVYAKISQRRSVLHAAAGRVRPAPDPAPPAGPAPSANGAVPAPGDAPPTPGTPPGRRRGRRG